MYTGIENATRKAEIRSAFPVKYIRNNYGGYMKICRHEGCNIKYHARGYCKNHYMKLYNVGKIKPQQPYENHGMRDTLIYQTWFAMKQRCYDKNQKHFNRYGGRGIVVCDRWKNSFSAFYKDMGKRPFKKAQIDRINNDGNYEPSNCRWVTNAENCRNQIRTVMNWFTARSLRRLYKMHKYTNIELAKIYKMPLGSVGNIVYNSTWKEIQN